LVHAPQAWVLVLQIGCAAGQSALVLHWTHAPVAVSQTSFIAHALLVRTLHSSQVPSG
jgi:hypothetical protein